MYSVARIMLSSPIANICPIITYIFFFPPLPVRLTKHRYAHMPYCWLRCNTILWAAKITRWVLLIFIIFVLSFVCSSIFGKKNTKIFALCWKYVVCLLEWNKQINAILMFDLVYQKLNDAEADIRVRYIFEIRALWGTICFFYLPDVFFHSCCWFI